MTTPVLNAIKWAKDRPVDAQLSQEWLVTNGLGGYASGTVSGASTRRFHGMLVAALQAPLGRTIMLNHLTEELELPDGSTVQIGGEERPDAVDVPGVCGLAEFRLEMGLPVWRYETRGVVIEKRVLMPHMQNTTQVSYSLIEAPGPTKLRLRPSMFFRPHEGAVASPYLQSYRIESVDDRHEVHGPQAFPPLRLRVVSPHRSALVLDGGHMRELIYRVERARGYDYQGLMWSPGHFRLDLSEGDRGTLIISTEAWASIDALPPEMAVNAEHDRRVRLLAQAAPAAHRGIAAELVLAADQFVISPATRQLEATQAHAAGDEARTVVAGYHWFTDWGRDTMISLEGLTLTTGRYAEAGFILRTFARHVRDGLIPNLFPEGEGEGLYHTADATLWFFHAVERYLEVTGDMTVIETLEPIFADIMEHHIRGTRFGIGVDPEDGLLRQGAEGYQLTWMDAKVDGWVVTPRRGKAVELNALFYNALKLLERWRRELGVDGSAYGERAAQVKEAFNRRFWNPKYGCLFDVVDGPSGNDDAIRPNQVLALSLTHPVLDKKYWRSMMTVVERDLLTPVGLRSLAPGHPDYKSHYDGDLRARDAAYHQGTVWAWLIGPFVDAWMRVHPNEPETARQLLTGFSSHLGEACIGSISEIFDAEPPFTPRGCVAQAWSVAEVLRGLAKLAP